FAAAQDSVGDLDSSEVGLDEAHEEAAAAAVVAATRAADLTDQLRAAQTEASTLSARVEALSLGIDRRDGTRALLTAGGAVPGLIGAVSDALEIAPGFETAIAAALGPVADAVAVGTVGDAVRALGFLREQDGGRAGVLVQGPRTRPDRRGWPDLPAGAHWAVDLLTSKDALAPALARWLDRVVVVGDMATAVDIVQQIPDVRAVTVDGDLIGPEWAVGGSTDRQSLLEITATRDRAAEQLAATRERVAELTAALAGATAEVDQRRQDEARTLAALHHSDARMSAVAEELARFGSAARSSAAEAERLDRQRQAAEAAQEQHRAALSDLQDRLFAVQSEDAPEEVDPAVRDALAERTAFARQREVEARLVQRTAEERARATEGNAEALRRSARQERQHRQRVAAAEARRAASSAVAVRVVELGKRVAQRLEISLATAAVERDRTMAARTAAETDLAAVRVRAGELQTQWERLTDAVHSTEVLRAQQTQQLQQLSERAIEEFTIPADELIAGYGPHVPVPPTLDEMAEYQAAKDRGDEVAQPPAMPYDRPSQERRLKRAERDLTALGKVNPLALEEFAALEERHKFLATQLEDLKATRKDLLSVIKEVDEKILELFESAYFDVAREFKAVFSTLFPGGEGELVLTDPSDMLATGIEVNARPPGKKVKRLSLLSGGERSLTAVALLVAIFRARPSPFYIMDEVEAALDEVNLTRLVGLMTELRESSQLIVITHQKFTMESADALYGVSMRGDGITQVISQRIRERPESPTARREAVGAAS
ncbi:AAA family ATPase, partial [Nakamurella sp. GG22]